MATLLLAGCGNNLVPSGADNRPQVVPGSIGFLPGQKAPNFTLSDSLGNPFTLYDHLAGGAAPAKAVVLYFTMWCPICTSHTDHLLFNTVPLYAARGPVVYGVVDYVSGSAAGARAMEMASGYAGSAFTVLADVNLGLFNRVNAAMGTTVLIDSYGTVLMNEDYRTGANLSALLNAVLP